MNQAIKLNPNFSSAFMDRGIVVYDKHDYDRTLLAGDKSLAGRPGYAVSFGGRGSGYENRREGDRIIQDASAPVRNTQYNALAYSPDTFPPASPALLASAAEPQRSAAPPTPSPGVPPPARATEAPFVAQNARATVHETAKPAPQAREAAISRTVKRPPMPTPAPHRALHPPRVSQQRHQRLSQPRRIDISRRAALSRAAAGRRDVRTLPPGR